MSKTFKMTVNFPLSLVVPAETIKDFTETRKEAREIFASGKVLKGEAKFRVDLLASDKTDDEVLETVYRAGIRQILREGFIKDLCGNEARGRLGDVKVVYEAAPKRSCQGCTQMDCSMDERLTGAGCQFKTVGTREPVNLDIPRTFSERIVSGWDAGDV